MTAMILRTWMTGMTAGRDSDEDGAAKVPPAFGFKPTDGVRMFLKESSRYISNMPFDSIL